MKREEYINFRTKNSPEPLYEYYKEHHKGGILLAIGDFFKAMQMWPHAVEAFNRVIRFYDEKFEVMTITNVKTGQLLKYV